MLAFENTSQLLGRSADVAEGGSLIAVEGREIAVFRRDGRLFAIDDHCPHKKASLATGQCCETSVACPWHGWQFDLRTGESLDHPGFRVAAHEVEERGDELWIRLAETAESEVSGQESEASDQAGDEVPGADDWAESVRCLVRYGAMSWAGYFRHRGERPISLRHGERVLVQTTRGAEVGEVLSSLSAEPPRNDEGKIIRPAGELLRSLNPMESFEHARRQRDARLRELVESVVSEAARRIADRGVAIDLVDGEMLFGDETLVLYFLGPPTADLGRLATELGQGREYKVVFNSVIEQPAAASSGGCGSGGCGCST